MTLFEQIMIGTAIGLATLAGIASVRAVLLRGAITTGKIKAGAITAETIADGAITPPTCCPRH